MINFCSVWPASTLLCLFVSFSMMILLYWLTSLSSSFRFVCLKQSILLVFITRFGASQSDRAQCSINYNQMRNQTNRKLELNSPQAAAQVIDCYALCSWSRSLLFTKLLTTTLSCRFANQRQSTTVNSPSFSFWSCSFVVCCSLSHQQPTTWLKRTK